MRTTFFMLRYTTCCAIPRFGSPGGVRAIERSRTTVGSDVVTSCPWCERNLKDAAKESGLAMPVYDVAEIFLMAIKS